MGQGPLVNRYINPRLSTRDGVGMYVGRKGWDLSHWKLTAGSDLKCKQHLHVIFYSLNLESFLWSKNKKQSARVWVLTF